jgi:hypothetical protein
MNNLVYGVDISQEVTPAQVRDALVECFNQAHCEMVELGDSDEVLSKEYCKSIVKNAFKKVGGDFEIPTKDKLGEVVGHLAKFSETFRNKEVIEKHAGEIADLVGRLK